MSYIRNIAPGVIRYTCGRYSRDDLSNCTHTVARDLEANGMSIDSLKDSILVLDFLAEGHDPVIIAPLVEYLTTLVGIDNIRVLFNAVVDTSNLSYRARSFVTHFANQDGKFINPGNQSTVKLEQKFLCLSRRPSLGRAQFVSQLVSTVPDIRASFGSGFPEWSQEFQQYFPNHTLPILIDGDARQYVHNQASDIFRTCLFNVIIETSNQTDNNSWNSIFITEKTFKCFDLYQIPIWFAVPDTVAQIRRLGFDLFDDIIDHSYDQVNDPVHRKDLVIDQIKKLNDCYTLLDCQQIRSELWNRLQSNYIQLDQLIQKYEETHNQLIAELTA